MAGHDGHLLEVLDGYAKFFQDKNLAMDKHQPYLVRSVAQFLRFARAHGGYSFEQTLDLFLAEAGGRVGTRRGSFSRRRMRSGSTAISTVEPRQGSVTRRPLGRSCTTTRGWRGRGR